MFPKEVRRYTKSWLFGIIQINYIVEDRRPDLKKYDRKYKHLIYLYVFSKRYTWVIHSPDNDGEAWPYIRKYWI